jgi:hypothetical protein
MYSITVLNLGLGSSSILCCPLLARREELLGDYNTPDYSLPDTSGKGGVSSVGRKSFGRAKITVSSKTTTYPHTNRYPPPRSLDTDEIDKQD